MTEPYQHNIGGNYTAKVERDGDDLVLVFSHDVLEAIGAKPGDQIEWELHADGTVTIKPIKGDHAIAFDCRDAFKEIK